MTSYPRAKHGESKRSSRPRKKKSPWLRKEEKEASEEEIGNTSASNKKLRSENLFHAEVNRAHAYKIIDFLSVFQTLAQLLICRKCQKNIEFRESGIRGFGFKIVVVCSCGSTQINSGPLINTGYEINRRIVLVMRLLGIGQEGINIFAGLMDLGTGLSNSAYENIMIHLYDAVKFVFDATCMKAVAEEKTLNERNGRPASKFYVSGDGSWKKRGFTSLLGVITLIGNLTGKVIDLVIKSAICKACTTWKAKEGTDEYTEWYEEHEQECLLNHSGSSGKMEVDSIKEMFSRSQEKYGVQYVNYIGDSETFKAILDLNPYGNDCPVKKSECVGHIEKRMGTRLRNVKKEKKLGGRGKLTDVQIKKLTRYYGLAIRRNTDSVQEMKKAIQAILDHLTSTDATPNHGNCPAGADSWCKWRKAEAAGRPDSFSHPPPLHPDVHKNLQPIFADLSQDTLLERCLGGYTQNKNESFNSTVWHLSPKHIHSGAKTVSIAAYIAASIFNEGYNGVLMIMSKLGIEIGIQAHNFAESQDEKRINRQDRRTYTSSKEARTARRMEMLAQNEFYEEAEGILYGAGIAD